LSHFARDLGKIKRCRPSCAKSFGFRASAFFSPRWRASAAGRPSAFDLRIFSEVNAFTILQCAESLANPAAFLFKLIRRLGVEGEHIEMMWDSQSGAHLVCELGGLDTIKVSCYTSFGLVAINGQADHIEVRTPQCRNQAIMQQGVAAMVDGELANPRYIAQKAAMALLVPLNGIVS
jgi:hypothetical protein